MVARRQALQILGLRAFQELLKRSQGRSICLGKQMLQLQMREDLAYLEIFNLQVVKSLLKIKLRTREVRIIQAPTLTGLKLEKDCFPRP